MKDLWSGGAGETGGASGQVGAVRVGRTDRRGGEDQHPVSPTRVSRSTRMEEANLGFMSGLRHIHNMIFTKTKRYTISLIIRVYL